MDEVYIRFTRVQSPSEFWGICGTLNELDEHKKLEERLTKWAQNEYQRDGPQAIHPYQRILVKNLQSDKNFVWSRARICDILPDNTLTVFLIDYGHIEKIESSHDIITEIPDFFNELTTKSKRCFIKDIKPSNIANEWTKEALDYFKIKTSETSVLPLFKIEESFKKLTPYSEFEYTYAVDPYFKSQVNGKIIKIRLADDLISKNFADHVNIATTNDNSTDSSYSNVPQKSFLAQNNRIIDIQKKNIISKEGPFNKFKKIEKENKQSYRSPFEFLDDTNDIQEFIYSDETLMTGFKPNIKFQPDIETLRSVMYGNRKPESQLKSNQIHPSTNELISKVNKIFAVNSNDDTNFIAQELMSVNEWSKTNVENCDSSLIIVKLLLDRLASSNECAEMSLEVITFLSINSTFCNTDEIKRGLDELKATLTESFMYEINEASLEKFIKIITSIYKRSCNDQFKSIDWLYSIRQYCTYLLLEWIEVYPHVETSELKLRVKFTLVREFLKRAIETLKVNDFTVVDQILKKASIYGQNNNYSNRVKKIAFEIVEIYAISFLKAPLVQEKKVQNESFQIRNRFMPIKRNGKRKLSPTPSLNPYTEDIILID